MTNYQYFNLVIFLIALSWFIYSVYRMNQWLPIARMTLDRPVERDQLLRKHLISSATKAVFLVALYTYAFSCAVMLLNSIGLAGWHVYLAIILSASFSGYIVFLQCSMYPLSLSKISKYEYSTSLTRS